MKPNNSRQLDEVLVKALSYAGYKLAYLPLTSYRGRGYTNRMGGKYIDISIAKNNPCPRQTLAHETAHIYLNHLTTRTNLDTMIKELEAEYASMLLFEAFGLPIPKAVFQYVLGESPTDDWCRYAAANAVAEILSI